MFPVFLTSSKLWTYVLSPVTFPRCLWLIVRVRVTSSKILSLYKYQQKYKLWTSYVLLMSIIRPAMSKWKQCGKRKNMSCSPYVALRWNKIPHLQGHYILVSLNLSQVIGVLKTMITATAPLHNWSPTAKVCWNFLLWYALSSSSKNTKYPPFKLLNIQKQVIAQLGQMDLIIPF